MTVIKRQSGERRWGLPVEFPVTDRQGVYVLHDRRKGGERRKAPATIEDLLILFYEIPSVDTDRKQ